MRQAAFVGFCLATASAAYLALLVPATAQDKNPGGLKISSWLPPAHPLTGALEAWGKSLEGASKGTVKYQLFPAQELGKAHDHYNMARVGLADLSLVNPLWHLGRYPVLEAGALPLLIANGSGGTAALDEWYRKYAEKEMSGVRLCLIIAHDPGVLHSKKMIAAPSDAKGLKVHSTSSGTATLAKLIGAASVGSSITEARRSLERGEADSIISSWNAIVQFKLEQTTKFHLDLPLSTTPLALVMNSAAYARRRDDEREIIDRHCNAEWAGKIAAGWVDSDLSARAQLEKRAGHSIFRPAPMQVAQWRKATNSLVQQWSGQVSKAGWNAADVLSDLKTSLAKHNAIVQ
jgi:TRAP-type transport system periplasmic protein